MNELQQERLREMAGFLNRRNFNGINKFDFGNYTSEITRVEDHICGTAACAIGLMPIAFPKDFDYHYNNKGYVNALVDKKTGLLTRFEADTIPDFFGITPKEASALFYPSMHTTNKVHRRAKLTELGPKASPGEVASNMLKFLDYKISGKAKWHAFIDKVRNFFGNN